MGLSMSSPAGFSVLPGRKRFQQGEWDPGSPGFRQSRPNPVVAYFVLGYSCQLTALEFHCHSCDGHLDEVQQD